MFAQKPDLAITDLVRTDIARTEVGRTMHVVTWQGEDVKNDISCLVAVCENVNICLKTFA
jgi:hypothetical protein